MKKYHGFSTKKTNPIQTQFWRLLVFIRVNSWLILQNKANFEPHRNDITGIALDWTIGLRLE